MTSLVGRSAVKINFSAFLQHRRDIHAIWGYGRGVDEELFMYSGVDRGVADGEGVGRTSVALQVKSECYV
jgi:hypothetical protein